jgi:hypothetical protein
MANRIPNEIIDRIIMLWYGGCTRDEISKIVSRSSGFVSQLIEEERERNGPHSVEHFRRLAQEAAKHHITIEDIQRAIPIRTACD